MHCQCRAAGADLALDAAHHLRQFAEPERREMAIENRLADKATKLNACQHAIDRVDVSDLLPRRLH